MKKIMVFGTFDGLHLGHLDFFRQAKRLGKLFAVVARDSSVKKIKQRSPQNNERSRLSKVVRSTKVSQALLGNHKNFFKPIEKIKPDIIALGFDQKTFSVSELKTNLKKYNLAPKIIRLKSYKPCVFKSSLLRKKS
jgi:FAD synthetase